MKHEATADALVESAYKQGYAEGSEDGRNGWEHDDAMTEGYMQWRNENAAALKSIEQPASPDDEVFAERLREVAKDRAQMGRLTPGVYPRPPREHIEWEAASRIRQLSAQVKALEAERDEARSLVSRAQQNMGPYYSQWHADAAAFFARKAGAE